MTSNRQDLVRILQKVQTALEELDRVNVGAARSSMFDVNWQLRELLARVEQVEQGE